MKSNTPLLVAFSLLVVAALVWIWAPWQTAVAEPGSTADTTQPRELRADAKRAPSRDPVETRADPDPPPDTRGELTADVHTSVRGAFLSPRGVWPGGGTVSLLPAADRKQANPMNLFSMGLDQARKERKRALAGETGGNELPEHIARMLGIAPPVVTVAVDDRGAFVIDNPPAGRFELRLNHAFLASEFDSTIEIARGDVIYVGVIPTKAAASLLVMVSDRQGKPIADANLEIHHPIDRGRFMQPSAQNNMVSLIRQLLPKSARTDERGVHLFEGLSPHELWNLEIYHEDFIKEFRAVQLLPGRENLLQVQMATGVGLEVAVVHPDGEPCSRATVRVEYPDYHYPKGYQKPGSGGKPDVFAKEFGLPDDGHLVLDGLLEGRAIVRVRATGFFPQEKNVLLRATEANEPVRFVLEEGESIEGKVLDEDGKPVEDARVLPIGDQAKGPLGIDLSSMLADMLALETVRNGVPTDAEGRFRIGGFEHGERARLMALAKGHDVAETTLVVAGAKGVEITLRKLAEVRGRVVADKDSKPVPACSVKLEEKAFLVLDKTVAGEDFTELEDGAFTLRDAPRGSYAITIEAPGLTPFTGRVDLRKGSVDLGEVRLPPPSGISGTVLDPSGTPVHEAEVSLVRGGLMDQMAMASGFADDAIRTDENGEFELSPLQGRKVRLLVRKTGLAPLQSDPITLRRGAVTKNVVLRLTAGGSLGGVLRDAQGEPLREWRAQAAHTRGAGLHVSKTDDAGRFSFDGLAPGTHKVECISIENMSRISADARSGVKSARDLGSVDIGRLIMKAMQSTVSERVVIREGEHAEVELTYRGPEAGTEAEEGLVRVAGEVEIGEHRLESGMVFLAPAGSTSLGQLGEVEDGRFTIDRVVPGSYRARVQAGVLSGTLGQPQVVEVPEAEDGTCRLALKLPGGTLRGKVVGADGTTPAPGVILSLTSRNARAPTIDRMEFGEGSVLSGDDGSFAFRGLQAGEYAIFAKESHSKQGAPRKSGRLSGLTLETGESRTGLVVRLREGGSLRVQVADVGGTRSNALVTLLDSTGQPTRLFQRSLTDRNGVVVWSGLPEGDYRVAVDAPQVAAKISEAIPVAAGVEQRVTVTLDAGIPVRVSVAEEIGRAPGDRILYTIWREDDVCVRSGSLVVPQTGTSWPIGHYAPGKYRVRVESSKFGVIDGTHTVPAKGVGQWTLTR